MELIEQWRKVWRQGVAPQLSDSALEALRKGLEQDDPRLVQGATTSPPPMECVEDWPVEGACALSYCGWQGDGLKTVGEVSDYFSSMCFKIDKYVNEPAACRWFLNFFDETPRAEMRYLLLPEVEREIKRRGGREVAT